MDGGRSFDISTPLQLDAQPEQARYFVTLGSATKVSLRVNNISRAAYGTKADGLKRAVKLRLLPLGGSIPVGKATLTVRGQTWALDKAIELDVPSIAAQGMAMDDMSCRSRRTSRWTPR